MFAPLMSLIGNGPAQSVHKSQHQAMLIEPYVIRSITYDH